MFVDGSTAPDSVTSVGGDRPAPSELTELELENELVSYDLKNAVNALPKSLVSIEEGRVSADKNNVVQCEFRITIKEPEKKGPPAPAPKLPTEGEGS